MASSAAIERFFGDFSRELERRAPGILFVGIQSLNEQYKERIFQNGLDSNMQVIAPKYTWQKKFYPKEMFVQKSKFQPNAMVQGQRVMYIPGGYEEFRRLNGRQVNRVDLSFTGSLSASLQPAQLNTRVVFGYTNRNEKRNKGDKLERQYGKLIFRASQPEIDLAQEVIQKEIATLIQQSLNNAR